MPTVAENPFLISGPVYEKISVSRSLRSAVARLGMAVCQQRRSIAKTSPALPTNLVCSSEAWSVEPGGQRLGETGPLSQGVQAGRKALRIRHINRMEVRKKRPRGFK